nr:AraC family transcriptional regulator [Pseudoalteromonas sp. MMG010]
MSSEGMITAIVELAQSRGIALHKLLRGTGIFEQDLLCFNSTFSVSQQLRLIKQFKVLMEDSDSGFLLGSQLINDTSKAAQTLLYSAHLGQALNQLNAFKMQLSPLLFNKTHLKNAQYYIYLHCGFAVEEELYNYILEVYAAAFYSLLKRLTGEYPQCEFDFNFKKPKHIHQYEQHLGLKLRFEQPCTRWTIAQSVLKKVNPNASRLRFMQVHSQLQSTAYTRYSFIEAVWCFLSRQKEAGLEQTATAFAMSSATFKRKLKHHNITFSSLVDEQKKYQAIYLLTLKAKGNEQVAKQLAFYDIPNFRRAFKRWTGLTPSQIKT